MPLPVCVPAEGCPTSRAAVGDGCSFAPENEVEIKS